MVFHPIPHQGAHTLEPFCFCVRDVETGGGENFFGAAFCKKGKGISGGHNEKVLREFLRKSPKQ
jgi:hypothetical protein